MTPDPQADEEVVNMLAHKDALQAELRALDTEIGKACREFGARRGYFIGYREFHVRLDIKRELEGK
jgi:hypothetical protein